MMNYLVRFEDENALDPLIVGQKFFALAKAARNGFSVPRAVAISTAAHHYYLMHRCWPDDLLSDVLHAATVLDLSRGLSIRSSATREDLEKQSFAGQYRSFLQVVNAADVRRNIEKCWQSVDSEKVRSYLKTRDRDDQNEEMPLMAVVIQKMVNARAAGIAFGCNPMRPAGNEAVVEAVKGLAEELVSGHHTPYRAVVDSHGRVEVTPPAGQNGSIESIHDSLFDRNSFWRDVARLVKDLEARDGDKPLDIEWAIDGRSKIWLLQARTVTTIDDAPGSMPAGLWTRKIANDLWADRLTPFLAHHMVKNASHFDHSRTLKILGLSIPGPTLTVIKGYLYINGESIKKGVSYIPPVFRLPELELLLPASAGLNRIPGPPISKLISICTRSVLLPVVAAGINPLICLLLAKRDLRLVARGIERISAMPEASPRLTLRKLQLSTEALTQLQIKNQWPYFFATFSTWVLNWLATDRLGLSHGEFLGLISQKANNISIEIEQNFRAMAKRIADQKELCDRFLRDSAEDLAADLPPIVQTELDSFLARYGCRSRHRTLFIKRWSESPQEVIGILQALVRNQQPESESLTDDPQHQLQENEEASHTGSSARHRESVDGAPQSISGRYFSPARLLVYLLIPVTRRFLDLREELRFAMDRILFTIRRVLLSLGSQTGLADKVMFLNEDELADLIAGRISHRQALRRADRRYNEFIKPFDAATFYSDGMAEDEFKTDGTLLKGIGTSPGRISGRAKIVDDPTQAEIQKGDILVARNTDPGWTPILSIVGGLVMEEGGLLNHCSIVARELGVPSIVGVQGATRQIRDNDRVTIDGGLGVVRIED